MKKPTRILIVEDIATDADLAQRAIRKAVKHCEFQVVETHKDFLGALESFQPDVVLTDYVLPGFDGMNALKLALKHAPFTPIIIWTGSISEDAAIDCIKAGANNYVLKDNLRRLGPAVVHALEERQLLLEHHRAEEKYQAIFENSVVGVFQSTPEGRFTNVNAAMARMYGYASPEEMINAIENIPNQIYVEPGKRAEFVTLLHLQGTVENFEQRNYRKDKTVIWTSTSARVVRHTNGNILYYEGFISDITERKQAEAALRFEKERFERIAAAVPGIICSFRVRPDGSASMPFASSAIHDVYGFMPIDLQEDITPLLARIHPDDLHQNNGTINESARTMLPWHNEFRYLHPTKGEIWIEGRSVPIREPDGSIIWHGFVYDITERKQADIELKQKNDDLALLNTVNEAIARGQKLDSVIELLSHELKRIFSTVGSTIYLLSPDKQSISMQQYSFSPEIAHQIEKLLGFAIPKIEIPIKEGGYFHTAMISKQSTITSEPQKIKSWIAEFVETKFLPSLVKPIVRRLIPQIYKLLNIRSMIIVPLISEDETIGFLDVSSSSLFKASDLNRIQLIGEQLTVVIQQQHASEKVRASEERFRQLADNLQEAFWMTDADSGQELYMSPAVEKIWGKPIDNLMREPDAFINSVYPEDLPTVLQNLEKEKSGATVEMEYRIMQPNGSLRWIWDRAFPIFDESGKVKRIAGISADITERKQSERNLRESEQRYHSLFQNLVDGFALHEIIRDDRGQPVDYIFLEINPAFEKLTGLSATDVVGRRATEILPGMENERFISIYGQVAFTGTPAHFEGYSTSLEKYFEINAYSPRYGQVAVTFIDVTERKQAEGEVRRRAEETSALLKTSLALTNLDLKTILQTISNSATNLFTADGCRIFLMEPDGNSLRCVLALHENSFAFSELRVNVGEGVTGAVAASGRAEIVNEMQKDPRSVQVPGTPEEAEAIMFAPLKERDHTIGVLSIRRAGSERPFRPADLELLEAFASMAASVVSNARLFEETQRRLAELEALYENGLAVGRLLKPDEIGSRIITTFTQYLRWHHATIRLKRENSDDLELVAFNIPNLKEEQRSHVEQNFNAHVSKVGHGLSGWVIQTGEPFRTGNVHVHPQYINTHPQIQSGLYMPLKVGGRAIGVITVESEVPNAFTEQDERLLATLASQAAIAFENARLYEAMQKELSERKRAEEALRLSETHYRELADSITDILFELDQNLHYTHWNKASEALTSIPAETAIGKSMHEIFGESAEQARIGKIYKEVLYSRQPRTVETTLRLHEEKRSFEINAYPSTRGVSVVAKDVTNRKRSEVIMQKRFELIEYSRNHSLNELMRRTIDEVSELTGSSIGFFHFVEADQDTLGRKTWSTGALQLFNGSEENHLAMDQAGAWAEAVHQRRSLIYNDYLSLSEKKGLPAGHIPITREIIIPIFRNERVVAVMGIGNKPNEYTTYDLEIAERLADYAWDITERKKMEEALAEERNQLAQRVEERTADLSRANSNLARALRVKDEFLANMSHELRTPLNAILGLSESLAEQIAGPLNEKQQKYITTISESGHHLLSLINDILDLAKIEAGQITLDINKVDIHSVCQASLRMVKQLAQKKNQELSLDIEEGLGLMWADERRLKQMMVNLLGNAVKFTPENGKIGLEIRGDKDANKITITVGDNGIGIKQDDITRLFQPFMQLDSGLARETTGTGLGLALVAQMVRLHGGSINVSSQPGTGSRFSIVLPWEPALALDAAARLRSTGKFPAIKPSDSKRPTILLVEDTKEVIMMLKDYLELAGYTIVTAQDGVDAIVQAKLTHPDLILMDVQMPRMDGMEATRKLRAETEFRDTPIIALTALAMPKDRERCLAAGMDEYISKPINLKALVKIIQSCLFNTQEMKSQ